MVKLIWCSSTTATREKNNKLFVYAKSRLINNRGGFFSHLIWEFSFYNKYFLRCRVSTSKFLTAFSFNRHTTKIAIVVMPVNILRRCLCSLLCAMGSRTRRCWSLLCCWFYILLCDAASATEPAHLAIWHYAWERLDWETRLRKGSAFQAASPLPAMCARRDVAFRWSYCYSLVYKNPLIS